MQLIPVAQTLQKLPSQWKREVEKALVLPPFPLDYLPNVVEIFDDLGVLAGSVLGVPYQCARLETDPNTFQAWYFDEQLAFFYFCTDNLIVVDRLSSMAKANCILKLMEGGQ